MKNTNTTVNALNKRRVRRLIQIHCSIFNTTKRRAKALVDVVVARRHDGRDELVKLVREVAPENAPRNDEGHGARAAFRSAVERLEDRAAVEASEGPLLLANDLHGEREKWDRVVPGGPLELARPCTNHLDGGREELVFGSLGQGIALALLCEHADACHLRLPPCGRF